VIWRSNNDAQKDLPPAISGTTGSGLVLSDNGAPEDGGSPLRFKSASNGGNGSFSRAEINVLTRTGFGVFKIQGSHERV